MSSTARFCGTLLSRYIKREANSLKLSELFLDSVVRPLSACDLPALAKKDFGMSARDWLSSSSEEVKWFMGRSSSLNCICEMDAGCGIGRLKLVPGGAMREPNDFFFGGGEGRFRSGGGEEAGTWTTEPLLLLDIGAVRY